MGVAIFVVFFISLAMGLVFLLGRSVTLRMDLPRASSVDVNVLDVSGRHVSRLVRGDFATGRWPLRWQGVDEGGQPAAPGVYYVRMDVAGRSWARRVVLIR